MNVNFAHKPDYFLFAQLLIRHLEDYIKKNPDKNSANFELRNIYDVFCQDLASTTINLDGILNIADEYTVDTLSGDQKIINQYQIDAKENTLKIDFNSDAVAALRSGKPIVPPDATLHQ